jgi:hypothetical protein
MTTYPLQDGMTLVLSVDDGEWQTVTFSSPGFADVTAATAGEIAKVLKKSGVGASVDADGLVVIQSTTIGEGSSLEVDTLRSTAALALGLGGAVRRATGTGPKAARVESEVGPFAMPRGARMTVGIDGTSKKVTLNAITDGRASAAEVVHAINAVFKGAAHVTREQRVAIASPTTGRTSSVTVEPGPVGRNNVDAAGRLGFIGPAAADTGTAAPGAVAAPARRACAGAHMALQVRNLTASPVQFLMVTRGVLLPSGGAVAISPAEAAHRPLQRLIERGVVQLVWTLTPVS